jgi:hypothetical protein
MCPMRRILAIAFGVVSVPVGIGVGLWMAQLTSRPPCVAIGLGTQALCIPQRLVAPSVCVLCGGAAAAVLLLTSIVVHRHASLAPAFDLAAAVAGIVIGLWAWTSVTYVQCGPRQQICGPFALERFTSWESALIGAVAAAAIVGLGCAASSDLLRMNLATVRRLRRWLFSDLSQSAPVDGTQADTG